VQERELVTRYARASTAGSLSIAPVSWRKRAWKPTPSPERLNQETAFADDKEPWSHKSAPVTILVRQRPHPVTFFVRQCGVPLEVHARYTRAEILAAFDIGEGARVAPWQTGVYWAPNSRADLLAFTLDKTTGQFSPTTRYRDYAISPDLIHWESQSVTRADSDTGRRYQCHAANGSSVMLFARHRSDERAFYFLGPATYVKHESELPMAITWRLQHSLPGDLFAAFAAAVA
jgi:hypothetical protein